MINIKNVTKEYGKMAAIDRFSLKLPEKGIYCLLGRNGAGKTTLLKMLVGHIAATDGDIFIDGKEISPSKMPESVNYIESGSVQFNMRVDELIDTAAKLQDDFDRDFAQEMVERFELSRKKRFKQLSFGMKTMVTSIMSLANNSKVVLLDEPTTGFDAIMRDQFNTLLLESYHANPRLIIVSTHLIDEVAKVTERLIIIDKGKLLIEAGMDDIDEKAYTLSGSLAEVTPLLDNLNCIGKQIAGNVMAAHIYDERIQPPQGVAIGGLSLQDFFINIVGGRKNG
ncbi:MAG: ABC transporter ATP-binding protein [Defluviitaleaceae bacterium]|nr:ABC transporter ATP-binding protein [Defluviitaleaceae bacterium]